MQRPGNRIKLGLCKKSQESQCGRRGVSEKGKGKCQREARSYRDLKTRAGAPDFVLRVKGSHWGVFEQGCEGL